MTERPPSGGGASPRRVVAFVFGLAAVAAAVAVTVAPLPAPASPNWVALPVVAGLLLAATWFVVPFRHGDSVDAMNLVEAALAPLLVAYPPLVVVGVVALSQVANGLLRRLSWVKTLFNTAMWALAAGLGAAVVAAVGPGPTWPHRMAALLAALAVVGIVNAVAFTAVFALAEAEPRLRGAAVLPAVRLAWFAEWGVNAAVGLLFALAFIASPLAAVLFVVPLLVLHMAYRSYTTARADQALLVATHRSASRLAEPLQPLTVVPDFLRELVVSFDAAAAELVLRGEAGREIHRVGRAGEGYTLRSEGEAVASLEGALVAIPGPARVAAGAGDPLARRLETAGAADCLAAPLLDGDQVIGAIAILDRGGFEGSQTSELAVLEALARETTSALAKGRLLADVLEERRKLAEIVGSASDGICTFAEDGTVLTWNPALEGITGLHAREAIGRTDIVEQLGMRSATGVPVTLEGRPLATLPTDIRLTAVDGSERHLTCSYSAGEGETGASGAALIVLARDVTPIEEHEALRRQFDQLVQADAARRLVVEQLQEAVMPAPLTVPGAEIAAAYEASDPSAPTGGDLYDWLQLSSGELHLAVVDVLGHGVSATKDALAVTHTLRVVSASGTPLRDVVARADEVLGAQHPDLVATVLVARYEPGTGRLQVAAGGHPPALVVTPRREVMQVAASGGVIGWPNAGSDNVVETLLEPGDALVMYTDGLVEARKNILDGMEALVQYAAEVAQFPADRFARELVSRALAGADRRDDTLALVLRRDLVPAGRDRAFWDIEPEAAAASATRQALGDWLAQRGIDGQECVAAAGELLSNAVRSARSRVALRVELVDRAVVLDVSDDGVGPPDLAQRGRALPPADRERGRGLYLVRALSEHMDVLSTGEGSTVRAVLRRLPAPPSPRDRRRTRVDGRPPYPTARRD